MVFLWGLFPETGLFKPGGGGAIFKRILFRSGMSFFLSSDDLFGAGVGLREPEAPLLGFFGWAKRRVFGRVAAGLDFWGEPATAGVGLSTVNC